MAIQTLNTIKNWFKTGLIPTQEQFWDVFDSYRHKLDKIPVEEITGLDNLLQEAVNIVKNPVYKAGEFAIFKRGTTKPNELEPEDYVIGMVEGKLIEAKYLGGNTTLLESFMIFNEKEF
ncbi:hypothetical protein [uncultured Flavobacterium sp.]|uniref:hypothetical protein n=1 Tax=uncultured Flavobacterium sp. TaxID=165435 RepID=UPI0025DCFE86|nr:hypothetical protein [uncultured Flavobacterium sp.]